MLFFKVKTLLRILRLFAANFSFLSFFGILHLFIWAERIFLKNSLDSSPYGLV